MGIRAAVAIAVLAVVGLGLWWTLTQAPGPGAGATGTFSVYVVGPEALLHDGNVTVAGADALAVLVALGGQQGFAVQVDDLEGCAYDYVRGVAGHAETGTGGWNYYVRSAGAASWEWQGLSAACRALDPGDAVLWCWVEPDERCAVEP